MFGFKFDNKIDREINKKYKYQTYVIKGCSVNYIADQIDGFCFAHQNIELVSTSLKTNYNKFGQENIECLIVYKEMIL